MIKKIYLITLIFLLTVSCGVKNDPLYEKKKENSKMINTKLKVTL